MGKFGWLNVDGIRVVPGGVVSTQGHCTDCDFEIDEGRSVGAVTAAARRHVKATSHTMRLLRQHTATVEVDR